MGFNVGDETTVSAEKRVGRVLNEKWRLEKLVGTGGMASVYRAVHANNMKAVAIKMLHAEHAVNAEVKKRFLREGYIANKVGHDGAVSVLDDGTDDEDGSAYLVMELLEGQTLRERAERNGGKLSPRELLVVVDGMLTVLAAAHAQAIVHRDLKPDNIFITTDGVVKILDFGVARVQEVQEEGKTRTGIVLGTPEYMPAEQARGRSEQIDGRTDLFAVGALMFRLLTGRYVHEAETNNETLLLAMTEPAKKLAEVLPEADEKLAHLIDTALAYDKEQRFENAGAMQAAVREALASLRAKDEAVTAIGTPSPLLSSHDISPASVRTNAPVEAAPEAPKNDSKPSLWVHREATPVVTPVPVQRPSRSYAGRALVLLLVLSAITAFAYRAKNSGVGTAIAAPSGSIMEASAPSAAQTDLDAALGMFAEEDAEPDDDLEIEIADAEPAAVPMVTAAKPPTKKPPTKKPPSKKHR